MPGYSFGRITLDVVTGRSVTDFTTVVHIARGKGPSVTDFTMLTHIATVIYDALISLPFPPFPSPSLPY